MLSIITTWRDRTELLRTLPGFIAAARSVGGDVTVVNYSGSDALLNRQLAGHEDSLRVVEVLGQHYFNKSSAQNLGAHHTVHPVLFFCDCDILLDPECIARLATRVWERGNIFATLAGVRESEINSRGGKHVVSFGYELKIRTADGRSLSIVDHEEDAENGTRQAPGLLLVRRDNFRRIGGYNGNLHGWGWEDQDMISRLTLGAGLTRVALGHAIHLSHDDQARVAHYPVANRWESRDRMFRAALANYDNADFMGTYERDVANLPARVR